MLGAFAKLILASAILIAWFAAPAYLSDASGSDQKSLQTTANFSPGTSIRTLALKDINTGNTVTYRKQNDELINQTTHAAIEAMRQATLVLALQQSHLNPAPSFAGSATHNLVIEFEKGPPFKASLGPRKDPFASQYIRIEKTWYSLNWDLYTILGIQLHDPSHLIEAADTTTLFRHSITLRRFRLENPFAVYEGRRLNKEAAKLPGRSPEAPPEIVYAWKTFANGESKPPKSIVPHKLRLSMKSFPVKASGYPITNSHTFDPAYKLHAVLNSGIEFTLEASLANQDGDHLVAYKPLNGRISAPFLIDTHTFHDFFPNGASITRTTPMISFPMEDCISIQAARDGKSYHLIAKQVQGKKKWEMASPNIPLPIYKPDTTKDKAEMYVARINAFVSREWGSQKRVNQNQFLRRAMSRPSAELWLRFKDGTTKRIQLSAEIPGMQERIIKVDDTILVFKMRPDSLIPPPSYFYDPEEWKEANVRW